MEKEKKVYLTKRLLVRLARKAGKAAAKEAMEVMGYVVCAKDGWVIKQFADGSIERIHEIEQVDIV